MSALRPLHVVSVSLGSSSRDVDVTTELLGHELRLERRGVDGDVDAARRLVGELDGRVDAIGLGGIDLFLQWAGRRYYFRQARRIASAARTTPVVCGAGLKDSLERRAVALLERERSWRGRRVLMTLAVDRFGMAEALLEHGAEVRFGDLMFSLGIPWRLHSMAALDRVARLVAPVVTRVPISWVYPTGEKQTTQQTTERYQADFGWAETVAGDWHSIRRFAPASLDGLELLSNTTTRQDVAFLRQAGARRLITTTPRYAGRSVATNLLEAAFVAMRGADMGREGYEAMLDEMDYRPEVMELGPESGLGPEPMHEPQSGLGAEQHGPG